MLKILAHFEKDSNTKTSNRVIKIKVFRKSNEISKSIIPKVHCNTCPTMRAAISRFAIPYT